MRRILFHCFGLPVHSYAAMLYLGIVSGIYVQLSVARSVGIGEGVVLTAILVLLTAALFGARLLHVAGHWSVYKGHPRRILRCSDGGASMYGGILLAAPLSVPLLMALGIPFGVFWDLASFAMLVGMIITRAGCVLNGCCSGRPTEAWCGINLPNYRGEWRRRIPTQILEAAWGSVVLAGAGLLWGRLPFPGALFLYSIAAYGLGRLTLESMRDEQDTIKGVGLHRAISAGLILVAVGGFAIERWL